MYLLLFENQTDHLSFLPLTFTRAVGDLRVGILTIREKWQYSLGAKASSCLTQPYLQYLYPPPRPEDEFLYIRASVLPQADLLEAIRLLAPNEAITYKGELVALRTDTYRTQLSLAVEKTVEWQGSLHCLRQLPDIFRLNGVQIAYDFELLCRQRPSARINDAHVVIYGQDNIFVEDGAQLKACILNAEDGPIYIARDAHLQELSVLKGPLAVCEGAVVTMGARMRGDTTIGPYCKVGGEVSNSVFWGYSNKAHEGFVGNSVIGAWCNLGAGTNTSNLKNNYGTVKLWSYQAQDFVDTGLQFCGLMMGDHSKAGINTMFNTGTVVGVGANIFGGDFPPKYVPSFSWGGAHAGWQLHDLEALFETATRMMQRRHRQLSETEKQVLEHLHKQQAEQINLYSR